jgi:broad specificity phosphatase PhoE
MALLRTAAVLARTARGHRPAPTSDDPPLNAAGRLRADALARMVGGAGVTTILTSQFLRTRQTAAPLAVRLGLTPQLTPAPAVLAARVRTGELGGVVLVAGHSNTIPEILTALGATAPPPITEAEFDNLYVAAVSAEAAQLVHLGYSAR